MRRLSPAEVGLLVTVVIWGLNFPLTKYAFEHGVRPLAWSGLRFFSAALIFAVVTLVFEGSLRMSRRDLSILFGASVIGIWLNQIAFVYAIDTTTASTVALVFGTLPIFTMLFARVTGIERMSKRVVAAALVSFPGVALVALGAHGGVAGNPRGISLALFSTATWALYSVVVAPMMSRYSPFRVSAVGLLIGGTLLIATATPQIAEQDFDLPPTIWLLFAVTVVGALVITNVLWFTALDRVGPSRASLYANLQPFLGVLFAVLLLSETLTLFQVIGGLGIAAGIVLARSRPASPPAE